MPSDHLLKTEGLMSKVKEAIGARGSREDIEYNVRFFGGRNLVVLVREEIPTITGKTWYAPVIVYKTRPIENCTGEGHSGDAEADLFERLKREVFALEKYNANGHDILLNLRALIEEENGNVTLSREISKRKVRPLQLKEGKGTVLGYFLAMEYIPPGRTLEDDLISDQKTRTILQNMPLVLGKIKEQHSDTGSIVDFLTQLAELSLNRFDYTYTPHEEAVGIESQPVVPIQISNLYDLVYGALKDPALTGLIGPNGRALSLDELQGILRRNLEGIIFDEDISKIDLSKVSYEPPARSATPNKVISVMRELYGIDSEQEYRRFEGPAPLISGLDIQRGEKFYEKFKKLVEWDRKEIEAVSRGLSSTRYPEFRQQFVSIGRVEFGEVLQFDKFYLDTTNRLLALLNYVHEKFENTFSVVPIKDVHGDLRASNIAVWRKGRTIFDPVATKLIYKDMYVFYDAAMLLSDIYSYDRLDLIKHAIESYSSIKDAGLRICDDVKYIVDPSVMPEELYRLMVAATAFGRVVAHVVHDLPKNESTKLDTSIVTQIVQHAKVAKQQLDLADRLIQKGVRNIDKPIPAVDILPEFNKSLSGKYRELQYW